MVNISSKSIKDVKHKALSLGIFAAHFGLVFTLVFLFSTAIVQQAFAQSSNTKNETKTVFVDSLDSTRLAGFGDYTVEEAMARISGVQVNREGAVNLRGVGYNSYYVTVNGQRMAVTGLSERITDLGAIPLDIIKEIQLIKVLTPDMEADGLAGVINLKTFQPQNTESNFSGSIGGGLNPEYRKTTGGTGRTWLRYTGPVSDNLSIAMDVNYQRDQQAWESLEMRYGTADFGSGNVDVIERLSPGFQSSGSNRYGANFQLNFDQSETSSYFFHGMANFENSEMVIHENSWLGNEDWVDQFTSGTQAAYAYDMLFEEHNIAQYTFQAGGQHLMDALTLDYEAGWSQSNIERIENLFPFQTTGVEYSINNSIKNRPIAIFMDSQPQPEDMSLQEMNFTIDNYLDQEITGRVDVEIPISMGSVKLGSSARFTEKDANERGAFSEYHYAFQGFLNLSGFEEGGVTGRNIFDNQYKLDRLIDTDEALSFFQTSIPNMRLDETAFYQDSEIYNHFARENIYAGYGMATVEFGSITFIGGARVEHAASEYEGRKVEFNRFGQFEEASDTSSTNNLTELFPNAQLLFQLDKASKIKVAYSRSISRPDFELLAPFELLTPQDTSIFAGNPTLKPVVSDNLDLYVDYLFNSGGVVSLGGYFKNLSNFIEQQTNTIQVRAGDYRFFDNLFDDEVIEIPAQKRTFENTENKAVVYGIEVALQKNLDFLPGLLSHLEVFANYTWSDSELETQREEKTAIPGQSPHVVNAALGYNDARFNAQLSYHWSAGLLSELQEAQQLAPSISNGQVYLDRFQDGYQDLSASLRFNLSQEIQLWANVYNLLSKEQVEYARSRQHYPTSIYQRNGIEFNVGVRLDL